MCVYTCACMSLSLSVSLSKFRSTWSFYLSLSHFSLDFFYLLLFVPVIDVS